MNKKAQFFIISTVVMSIALTTIIILLTVPSELTTTSLTTQTRDLYDFNELINNFKTITSSLYNSWPGEQGTRTTITLRNNHEFNAENNLIVARLRVEDNALTNSFQLLSNGEYYDATFTQPTNGSLITAFNEDLRANQARTYHFYYNVISDANQTQTRQAKRSRIEKTSTEFKYYSGTYEAVIDASTGVITSLKVKGDNNNLAVNYGARVNLNNQDGMTGEVTMKGYENNVLELNASGMINSNVYLTQKQYYHPSMIIIRNEYEIKSTGTYNLSYVLDSTISLTSLAYANVNHISLNQPTEANFNPGLYYTVYKNNTSVGVLLDKNSLTTVQTSNGVDTRIQERINSYTPNKIIQEIILTPDYKNYTKQLITGKNYATNPEKESTTTQTSNMKYLSQPLIETLKGAFNNLIYYTYKNQTSNPRIIVLNNKNPSNTPTQAVYNIKPGNDLNTIVVEGSNNYAITTKNYNNNSYTNFILRNDETQGVTNTTYEMINLNGEDFTITVRMNSAAISDSLNAKVYSPNNTLVNDEVLTPATPGIFETKTINVKGFNVSGVYSLNLEGDDALFSTSTTLPLMNANPPIIINNTGIEILSFEASESFEISADGLKGTSARVALNNSAKTIFNKTTNFNKYVNHTQNNQIMYDLIITPGSTLIDTNMKLGTKTCNLNNNYETILVMNTPVQGKNYVKITSTPSAANKTVQYSNLTHNAGTNTLTNSEYSWDLDTETFFYKTGSDWFYNGDFYACTGTYGSCSAETTSFTYDSLIEDTALFKTALFTSDTVNPIIRHYNDTNLMEVMLNHDLKQGYTFGLNYKINGDDDTHYKTSFTTELTLGAGEVLHNSTQLVEKGWNYVGKRDGNIYTALIFHSSDLKQGDSVMVISDDYLRIGLNEYAGKIYFLIADSWNEIESITNSLNNQPEVYNKIIHYYYEYNSEGVRSSGTLIG